MHGKVARMEKCTGNNILKRRNALEIIFLRGEMHWNLDI
jgi:hypothetical protein